MKTPRLTLCASASRAGWIALVTGLVVTLGASCARPDRTLIYDTADAPIDTGATDVDPDHDSDAIDEDTGDTGDDAQDTNGQCPVVPMPPDRGLMPLAGEAGEGRTEVDTAGDYRDVYLWDAAGETRVGFRQAWGGALIYFGDERTNVIDGSGPGRGMQVDLHDQARAQQGCAHNQSCATSGTSCPLTSEYLGWSAKQGADRCDNTTSAEVAVEDDVLTTDGFLVHYNPSWDRADCTLDPCTDAPRDAGILLYVQATFVEPGVVGLTYGLYNPTELAHLASEHELPTVFASPTTAGGLTQLVGSDGVPRDIDQLVGDGLYTTSIASADGWATLQSEALDQGVAIYHENGLSSYQGWRADDGSFVNMRATFPFDIPNGGTVFSRVYLFSGAFDEVRATAERLERTLPPFGYLDAPAADAVVRGPTLIRGWAIDNVGVASVALHLDGVEVQELTYGDTRADVCVVWPDYPACPNVGFEGTFDFSSLSACPHLIEVVATDGHGNARVIANTRVEVSE